MSHRLVAVRLFAAALMVVLFGGSQVLAQEVQTDFGEELPVGLYEGTCGELPNPQDIPFVGEADLLTFPAEAFEDIDSISDVADQAGNEEIGEEEEVFNDEDADQIFEDDEEEELAEEEEEDEELEDIEVGLQDEEEDEDEDDEDDELEVVIGRSIPVWGIGESLDVELDNVVETQFAIVVLASEEAGGSILACGEFGGAVAQDQIVVPLLPVENSGLFGSVALAQGQAEGDEEVVFLGYFYQGTGEQTQATPQS